MGQNYYYRYGFSVPLPKQNQALCIKFYIDKETKSRPQIWFFDETQYSRGLQRIVRIPLSPLNPNLSRCRRAFLFVATSKVYFAMSRRTKKRSERSERTNFDSMLPTSGIAEGNLSLSLRTLAIQKELNPIKRNVDGVFRFKDLLESFIYSQKKGSKSRPFFGI